MDINHILFMLIFIILFYIIYKINNLEMNKESFDTVTDTAINTAVKKIYLADVEAIRLLSNFAIQLSQGGFTVPGSLGVSSNLTVSGSINIPGQLRTDSNNIYLLGPNGWTLHHNSNHKN